MAMAAARDVGAGGESIADRFGVDRGGDLFWERSREPTDPKVHCAPAGTGRWRAGGAASHFYSLASPGNHAEGAGDSRARACGNRTSFFGRGRAGRAARRFVLGKEGFAERSLGAEAANTHPG